MAFLDNSGDIILDAVLTDTGRMRLAKGDGSFRVTKFALADDEIDYSLYNRQNTSGSAYYDIEILQMPVFEAFTNNSSNMKNKLVSISRNNILYLPVIKLQNLQQGSKTVTSRELVDNGFILAVDQTTEKFFSDNAQASVGFKYKTANLTSDGIIKGYNVTSNTQLIVTHQGIDNSTIDPVRGLERDLEETAYIVEMDNRFMSIVGKDGTNFVPSYIDDDNIASYYITSADTEFVAKIADTSTGGTNVIAGARGTSLSFKLKSSIETVNSDYLFNQMGSSFAAGDFTNSSGGALVNTYSNLKSIITNINITGVTTGFGIDIPVRLVKKIQ